MELWILYGLIAYFIWSIGSIVEKVAVSNHIRNPFILSSLYGLGNILIFGIFFFIEPHEILQGTFFWKAYSFISGALLTVMLGFLFKSFQVEEVSRVIMLTQLAPLGILPLSYMLLGETLTWFDGIAFCLLIIAGILAIHKKGQSWVPKHAIGLIFITLVMLIVLTLMGKFTYNNMTFVSGFFWIRLGTFTAGVIGFFLYAKGFRAVFKQNSSKVGLVLLSLALIDFVGLILYNYAIFLGPIGLLSALGGVMPVFVFLLAIVLSVFYPKIMKEDLKGATLIKKIIALVIIVVAIALLNI